MKVIRIRTRARAEELYINVYELDHNLAYLAIRLYCFHENDGAHRQRHPGGYVHLALYPAVITALQRASRACLFAVCWASRLLSLALGHSDATLGSVHLRTAYCPNITINAARVKEYTGVIGVYILYIECMASKPSFVEMKTKDVRIVRICKCPNHIIYIFEESLNVKIKLKSLYHLFFSAHFSKWILDSITQSPLHLTYELVNQTMKEVLSAANDSRSCRDLKLLCRHRALF